jgi:two-component system, NtrC family, sensor kinase
MKCSRCQQDNPSHALFCLKCGAPVDGRTPIANSYADLKREIERLKGENEGLRRSLDNAVDREAATSEILRVISSSPTDVQPVFDAIADSASRLCEADAAEIYRVDGDVYRRVAHRGPVPIAGRWARPTLSVVGGRPPERSLTGRSSTSTTRPP